MTYDKSQMMRGTLEGCILKIIRMRETYGYEILVLLRECGFIDISEGTIYPLLLRLEKQGSIRAQMRPSPLGPRRKYYTITPSGEAYLLAFEECWKQLTSAVGQVMQTEEEGYREEK
ncbi:MAG: PadR family transcriptional regulator [Ruminococcaceae bacterium]|nr:PadR family transcriptional regulator [Oscillospiraceae bacterium]